MNNYKHLLLWSSLGVLALLITAAVQENFLKRWRQVQSSTATDSGPLDIRLRQVINPQLQTDRPLCVVPCWHGARRAESLWRPAWLNHILRSCTIRPSSAAPCATADREAATDKDDAHGDVHFWPHPMIPLKFADAGCGSCHTHLRVPNVNQLQLGSQLVERNDCLACHRIDGRGGTLRPGGGGMEGPDLSHIGLAGYNPDWFAKHLSQHEQATVGPWKDSFGSISDKDQLVVNEYLDSRAAAPKLVEAKALFHSLGCRGCHKVGGIGGNDGPDLTLVGDRDPARFDFSHVAGKPTLANWFAEHFRNPAKIVPGSQMPSFGLDEDQIEGLTLYMLSLRRSEFPEALWPQDRIRAQRFDEREFAADGATLYGTFCAACHGPAGEGLRFPGMTPFPAIANADFLTAASDEFLDRTISEGRPGRRMPAWNSGEGGLRPAEIDTLVAYLRELGEVPESPAQHSEQLWVVGDSRAGSQLYGRYCAGCHGANGEGTQAPRLITKPSWRRPVTTISSKRSARDVEEQRCLALAVDRRSDQHCLIKILSR